MRILGPVSWAVIAVGVVGSMVVPGAGNQVATSVLVATLGVVLRRPGPATGPRRRGLARTSRTLLALTVGIVLWASGSAVLNAGTSPTLTEFPSPGEWLFLAAYLAMAAFVLLDSGSRTPTNVTAWLEAVVVAGGAACLAGAILLTPAAVAFGQDGVPLLVALLYPMLDIVLAVLVVGQMVLRTRPASAAVAELIAGFLLFALADISMVLNLSTGTYLFTAFLDVMWGAGFALVVNAACRPPRVRDVPVPNRRFSSALLVAAAVVALLVLVARPDQVVGWYLTLPAVLTLLAAFGRLVLALRQAENARAAYRLSRTDDLTDLPNRRALLADIDASIGVGRPLALLLLDLDGFKDVNDTLGHSAGDGVLQVAGERIRLAVPGAATVARLGGDEFALAIDDDDPISLLEAAQDVRDALRTPLRVEELEIVLNASVGIALHASGEDGHDLLRRADVAMYQAKLTRAGALLYDASRDEFSRQRLRFVEDLRHGIAQGQMVVWYQPQVDAATQRVTGVEALVRWNHPTEGTQSPAAFLPAARRAGLMPALSEAVLNAVVADATRWDRAGRTWRVAMNLAPPELLGGTLLPKLFDAVHAAGLPRDRMVVEVTEDSFLADPVRARALLSDLRTPASRCRSTTTAPASRPCPTCGTCTPRS